MGHLNKDAYIGFHFDLVFLKTEMMTNTSLLTCLNSVLHFQIIDERRRRQPFGIAVGIGRARSSEFGMWQAYHWRTLTVGIRGSVSNGHTW